MRYYDRYMKTIIVAFGVIFFVVIATVLGYKYLRTAPKPTVQQQEYTETVSGKLTPGKGDDYSYVLISDSGKTIGVASQKIDLLTFVNKHVEITGSYSGSTLYAFTITEQ